VIEVPVVTITQKQLIAALIAVFLPALSWTGADYVRTRDVAQAAKAQADGLEIDVREIRQDTLRMLVLMHTQFTGNAQEIERLRAELTKLEKVAQ
jgi:hypothetical protein